MLTVAGRSVEGAIAQVLIPPNATLMRNTDVPTVHFLVGGHRGCPMPLMVELQKKGGPCLRTLRGKEVLLQLRFGRHIASRQREVHVIKGKIIEKGTPNVELHPQPKYQKMDMRRIDS